MKHSETKFSEGTKYTPTPSGPLVGGGRGGADREVINLRSWYYSPLLLCF